MKGRGIGQEVATCIIDATITIDHDGAPRQISGNYPLNNAIFAMPKAFLANTLECAPEILSQISNGTNRRSARLSLSSERIYGVCN